MRKLLVLLLCLSLFLGCKKEELSPFLKNSWGWAKAEINGVKWEANACRTMYYGTDSLISLGFSNADNYQQYEHIRFAGLKNLTIGKYYLPQETNDPYISPATYRVFVRGDNDLDCAIYDNLYDVNYLQNWIEITEYNEKTKEIKGKFSCNLLIDPKGGNAGVKCKPTDPDTIRIRNGTFHTRITN